MSKIVCKTLKVNLSLKEAFEILDHSIVKGSVTGTRVDCYDLQASSSTGCVVAVYEKYYMRSGSRATLTVTIDNFEEYIRVNYVGSGGKAGILGLFDYGAAEAFENIIIKTFKDNILNAEM